MFPIGDENDPRRGPAYITLGLIAANILAFVFVQSFGLDGAAIRSMGLVPAEILSGRDIVTEAFRARNPYTGAVYLVEGLGRAPFPVLLTLISHLFLHGGLGHLLGNLVFLGVFGDNVEQRLGKARFLGLYFGAGLLGAATQILGGLLSGSGLHTPMVGASGAISGLLGAYFVLFPGNRVTVLLFGFLPAVLSAWSVIFFWLVMQIGGGLAGPGSGGVAYLAHLGGFFAGWLGARLWREAERARREKERLERLRSGESDGIRWYVVD